MVNTWKEGREADSCSWARLPIYRQKNRLQRIMLPHLASWFNLFSTKQLFVSLEFCKWYTTTVYMSSLIFIDLGEEN